MATATVAQQLALEQLYIAYFGRAADPTGFAYWTAGLAAGTDNLQSIANEFSNSAESKALYPLLGAGSTAVTTQAATDFVTAVYFNLYHRAPDAVGLNYFLLRLTPTNAGDIIKGICDGAQGSDLTSIQQRDLDGLNYTTSHTVDTYTAGGSIAAVAGTFILTTGTDVATANIFTANLAFTPGGNSRVNTLQDEDQLTGVGTNPTLNATLGSIDGQNNGAQSSIITPKVLNGVETINAFFSGSASGSGSVTGLDLQNASATAPIKTFNITGITDNQPAILVKNFTAVPTNLGVANTSSPAGTVTFSVLDAAAKGGADATTLTLSNVNLSALNLNSGNSALSPAIQNKAGIENVTLVTAGAAGNSLASFSDVDLTKLTITGAGNLSISNGAVGVGGIDYGNQGKFTTIDGSAATGSLSIGLDSLDPAATAVPYGKTNGNVAFTLTTGSGADTISSTIDFGGRGVDGKINDIVDAGSTLPGGLDTLALSQTHSQRFTDSATYNNFEAVTITRTGSTHDAVVLAVDSTNVTNDPSFTLVNKESSSSYSAADTTTYLLENLTQAEATAITIKHSGKDAQQSGNDGLLNNIITLTTPTATTVGVTIVDGTNADPRFNFQINSPTPNVTITDSDTESNTVQLDQFTAHTGAITLSGGAAGQFLNLDAYVDGTNHLGYDLDTTGFAADHVAFAVDSVISGVYAADYRTTYLTSAWGSGEGEVLNAATITATGELADVIVRVSGSNIVGGVPVGGQNIQLGSGNDTVIFANRTSNHDTVTSSGLTILDTVSGGSGQDTIILDGSGHEILADTEWTNLSGIDVLRLAGATGDPLLHGTTYTHSWTYYYIGDQFYSIFKTSGTAPGAIYLAPDRSETTFDITVNNHLVSQTDAGNRITIINNDGDLDVSSESSATIDLRELDASHFVTFDGPNGNGTGRILEFRPSGYSIGEHPTQVVKINDATANGNNYLDGGDPDVSSTHRSNPNYLQIYNNAQVTIGDLANTKNFQTIEFRNSTSNNQTLALTLNDAVVDALVDSHHAASTISPETLYIHAVDSLDSMGDVTAASQLNVQAAQLTDQSYLYVTGSYAADTIISGAGNDIIYAYDPGALYGLGITGGGDVINAGGSTVVGSDSVRLDNGGVAYHILGDQVTVNHNETLYLYSFGNTANNAAVYDTLNISAATSTVYLDGSVTWGPIGTDGSSTNGVWGGAAGSAHVNVSGTAVTTINTAENLVISVADTSSTVLAGSGNNWITATGGSVDLGSTHGSADHVGILSGSGTITHLLPSDVLNVNGGNYTLSASNSSNIWFNATTSNNSLALGTHTNDVINVYGAGTYAHIAGSAADTINLLTGGTTLALDNAGGNDTIVGSFGTDTISLGVHTLGDTLNFFADSVTAFTDSPYSLHLVTGAVIGVGVGISPDNFNFTTQGGVQVLGINTTGDWVENGTVLGTNEMWSQTGGLIKFTTGDLNHTIQLPTHHGVQLASEIMSVLEYNWTTTANSTLTAYIDVENGVTNTWIFEPTSKSTGVVVELVGVNADAGLNNTATATYHAVSVF